MRGRGREESGSAAARCKRGALPRGAAARRAAPHGPPLPHLATPPWRSPSSTAPANSKIDATSTACQYLSALADTEVPNAFACARARRGGGAGYKRGVRRPAARTAPAGFACGAALRQAARMVTGGRGLQGGPRAHPLPSARPPPRPALALLTRSLAPMPYDSAKPTITAIAKIHVYCRRARRRGGQEGRPVVSGPRQEVCHGRGRGVPWRAWKNTAPLAWGCSLLACGHACEELQAAPGARRQAGGGAEGAGGRAAAAGGQPPQSQNQRRPHAALDSRQARGREAPDLHMGRVAAAGMRGPRARRRRLGVPRLQSRPARDHMPLGPAGHGSSSPG